MDHRQKVEHLLQTYFDVLSRIEMQLPVVTGFGLSAVALFSRAHPIDRYIAIGEIFQQITHAALQYEINVRHENRPLEVFQQPPQPQEAHRLQMGDGFGAHALGRGVEFYDMPVLRSIVRDASRDNNRFSAIVLGIVKSPEFQMRMKAAESVN